MSISVLCKLCQKPVSLEKARINETGEPVHEQCYVQAIRAKRPEARLPQSKPRLSP